MNFFCFLSGWNYKARTRTCESAFECKTITFVECPRYCWSWWFLTSASHTTRHMTFLPYNMLSLKHFICNYRAAHLITILVLVTSWCWRNWYIELALCIYFSGTATALLLKRWPQPLFEVLRTRSLWTWAVCGMWMWPWIWEPSAARRLLRL